VLRLALDTLRSRWAGFVGTFVGLALGVGLMSAVLVAMTGGLNGAGNAPLRYAAAPTVVTAGRQLTVDDHGHDESQPLSGNPGLSPALVARVEAAGRTVVDRTFYAQPAGVRLPGAGQPVGHAWSSAAFTPYHLAAGSAPASDAQVVLGGGPAALVGRQITVVTAQGPATFTVSGVTAPVSFEQAVFFTDAEAARLSPRVDALVAYGPLGAVRAAVSSAGAAAASVAAPDDGVTAGPVQVLTGDDRHQADAVTAVDQRELTEVDGLLGVAGGLAVFVAMFVTASTFAFSVQQRRRELAVLRCAGATPRQIARMVLAESAVIGTAASLAGALLGIPGGPLLAHWLVTRGEAPAWFQVSFSPTAVLAVFGALAAGVTVALLGAGLACLRAARVRPVEALREAEVDVKAMTPLRWLGGLFCLVPGVLLVSLVPLADPLVAVGLNEFFAVVLVVAFALLSPLFVRPLIRLFALPLAWLPSGPLLLARENATAAARRTAATATPVLATIGLAAAVLGSVASIDAAKATEVRGSVQAAYVIVPQGAPGLSRAAVERVEAVAGASATPVTSEEVYGPMPDSDLVEYAAQVVEPAGLARDFDLTVESGSLAGLNDGTIVVDQEWGVHVGQPVDVYLSDGTRARLSVAAVVRTGIGGDSAFLTPAHAQGALVSRIDVALQPGADRSAVSAALTQATRGLGGEVMTQAAWAGQVNSAQSGQSWTNATTVLLIALIYTGLSIINTLLMATAARSREFAILRLGGATARQVLRSVAAESVLIVLVGIALAAASAGILLAGLDSALRDLVGGTPVDVPWLVLGVTTALCALAAVLASVGAARFCLRTRPIELVGARE
jgi:putative ABC transport system permease protein